MIYDSLEMRFVFVFRILCTMLLFLCFKVYNVTSPGFLVGSLFLLDSLDCNVWEGKCSPYNYIRGGQIFTADEEYHTYDKVIDVSTYILFLGMFGNIFDSFTLKTLWVFTIYRFIGVGLYLKTGNRNQLLYFPDFVNSTMTVFALRYYLFKEMTDVEYKICIMMGMVFKVWFEYVKHYSKDEIDIKLGSL